MGSSIAPVRREIVHFGFRKNFSTIHGVSHIYENLLENVYHDRYSSCLFLDLSKALTQFITKSYCISLNDCLEWEELY